MKRRRICVVTTSRADFGLLESLLHAIAGDPALRLQVIASGMHLAKGFGETWREIAAAGVPIDRKVDLRLQGESSRANLRSLGLGLNGFADALVELQPAVVVLLGDRFELLAAATSALLLRIPIAHIHGGERSEGAIDESVRHAITKMATLHFAATEVYRRRIIQMGEAPDRVFNFGAPGLDRLHGTHLLSRAELAGELDLDLRAPVALVTFHPATLDAADIGTQVRRLAAAVTQSGIQAVFTAANADSQGARVNRQLSALCGRHPQRFRWIPHLGHRRYLSCLRHCALMIGNSSSGLTEAPSFRLPVVNVGDRQRGRLRTANVIDVPCTTAAIRRGIRRALTPGFRQTMQHLRNPYERFRDGSAGERIKEILKQTPLAGEALKKCFHDIP